MKKMGERERNLAALDLAIERGIADIKAGRVHEADEVFDGLEAELEAFDSLDRGEGVKFESMDEMDAYIRGISNAVFAEEAVIQRG